MHFLDLPNEILLHILQSCSSIQDVIALSASSRHLQSILNTPTHRLPTLYLAAEEQCGPLDDAVNLVTHNQSQPAHILRSAPAPSFALLKQLLEVGRVANAWADLYPCQKWRGADSALRRLLNPAERYHVRRACYRLWLYTVAFHTPTHPRTSRRAPEQVRSRAALMRPWRPNELAELVDLQSIFRQVLQSTVTPSNGTVIRRHKQQFPEDPFPLVSVTHPAKYASLHYQYLRQAPRTSNWFHSTPHVSHILPFAPHNDKYIRSYHDLHGTTLEGWGDEITHYYVLEDMLKLDPAQLLHLYQSIVDSAPGGIFHAGVSSKGIVECFVAGLDGGGAWFENNGETMAETIGFVVGERGGDINELREAVEHGVVGIVRCAA